MNRYCALLFTMGLMLSASPAQACDLAPRIEAALAAAHREAGNRDRDRYRRPLQTLQFFRLCPQQTVVEIWPSRGWYTEILAPLLRDEGVYFAAAFSMVAQRTPQWRRDMNLEFYRKLGASPEVYDRVIVTDLSVPERTEIAPPATADRVLTFRNVHNWMKGGYAEAVFEAMARALKPGGMLGVVEHRAKPGTSFEQMVQSGYVTEQHVIDLAQGAGLLLEARSELNANPADGRDHPRGVWTLPPSLRLGEQDRDRYLAIGESDRMTLLFRKPGR